MHGVRLWNWLLVLLLLLTAAPFATAQEEQSGDDEHLRFLRVTGERNKRLSLEVAVQEFERQGEAGPRVALVGVAHIGDPELYQQLQAILSEYDIVLYEAVTPAGVGKATGETDEERAKNTKRALRFVASVAELHREAHGRYPDSAEQLKNTIEQSEAIAVNWFKEAMTDAWSRPIVYESLEEGSGFRVTSYGSDGVPGGEGFRSDLHVGHSDDIEPLAIDRDNIQQQLASALGMAYQLAEMDYTAPNWRNSDMNLAQLSEAFGERDLKMGDLEAIAGGGFPAAVAKMLLGLVTWLDQMMEGAVSDMAKVMMIEVLSNQRLIEQSLHQMGEGFGEVLINERNKIPIRDLESIIRDEPEVESVAIFYGAAHMDDFARRLERLGYEPTSVRWIPAITWRVEDSTLHPRQVQQMRRMIRQTLREQMRQLQQMQQ